MKHLYSTDLTDTEALWIRVTIVLWSSSSTFLPSTSRMMSPVNKHQKIESQLHYHRACWGTELGTHVKKTVQVKSWNFGVEYRKIAIRPGLIIVQKAFFFFWAYFLGSLFSEGLIIGGNLAFQNGLDPDSPWAYIREGLLPEGYLRLRFGGLIFGGAYYRNF